MLRVDVKPEMLRWACERARLDTADVAERIPQFPAWEQGQAKPTLKQLERLAATVHAPIGYFFLREPPVELVPIPDYRTMGNEFIDRPSPDLLETIYLCQQRQEWYRDHVRAIGETAVPFVGDAGLDDDPTEVAAQMREALDFDLEARRHMRTWEEALRQFIEHADDSGVMVMVNGVVGNNNHRRLDPEEFRGFALSDNLAPLVFVNGADTKSAQIFTLAHELAHIWLGETGLSDVEPAGAPTHRVEQWCNRVAAEFLVPLDVFRREYQPANQVNEEVQRLARRFKVSTLVILRRIHDAGYLTQDELWTAYHAELERLLAIPRGTGGNFYLTQAARVSKRFASAVISSVLEGRGSFTESFRMLGIKKMATFHELAHSLGVV